MNHAKHNEQGWHVAKPAFSFSTKPPKQVSRFSQIKEFHYICVKIGLPVSPKRCKYIRYVVWRDWVQIIRIQIHKLHSTAKIPI